MSAIEIFANRHADPRKIWRRSAFYEKDVKCKVF
jgi:hypothetical protein